MLKKSLYIIFALALIVSFSIYNSRPLFYGIGDEYLIYTVDGSSLAEQVSCDTPFYPFMARVKGESCKIEKSGFDVEEFFKSYNAEIMFSESVDGVTSYYGYSKDIKFLKKIGGKAVNLHVAVAENSVTVGSPIIFGSF